MATTITKNQGTQVILLRAGDNMVVTPGTNAVVLAERYKDGTRVEVDTLRAAETYGEYLTDMSMHLTVINGSDCTYTLSTYTGNRVADLTATLGTFITSNAGVPDDAVQAAVTIDPTGADNSVTYTAVEYGTGGNDVTIRYVDPGAASQSLSVTVSNKAITVNLATNGSSVITTTAAQVKTAIEASVAATALVVPSAAGAGAVAAVAATALENGVGTGIGVMKGGICVDTTNGKLYVNNGTAAIPAWKIVTSA